ncbi:MAG: tetratricopeptide repeat protein [Xanthomonadales bacterium]|nr:tetratricopeptide repeat protein [Xanthomonadales bacterium]
MKSYYRLFGLLCILAFAPASLIAEPQYVGEQACKDCHISEHQQWQGSHHDLAMQVASETSVLGDFNNTSFSQFGVTSRFYKDGNRFMVNTEGADGKLQNYEISYVFGVYPLQQYMVKFPQGKIQVLGIAWDSRETLKGGQRWFSLYPNESIPAGDVLHWTGPNLNWNYMCADCHSTNLKKNYNAESRSYNTQWSEINVSCEACHGPASDHIAWSKLPADKKPLDNGLVVHLTKAGSNQWRINPKTRKPELANGSNANQEEIQVCAKCHSRRAQLDDDFTPGDNFRDHYLPALLTEGLYHPDGKINDEVFVYASFLQSRMYAAGVTCSDCHNPHTLDRKAEGDAICQQCHLPTNYASPKHHFHQQNSTGASCISCHMPAKTYMGVDERNDHSFRIPRPDIGEQLKIPDACSNCHQDKTAGWAATAMQKWYGPSDTGYQQFGPALKALQQQDVNALQLTYAVLMGENPQIAKATVISHLGAFPSRQTLLTSTQMLRSSDADTRRQAVIALAGFPLQHTIREIFASLEDPVKIVRIEAARVLAAIPRGSLEPEQKLLLDKVTEQYRQTLLFAADRPEAQLALAQLYAQLGQNEKAEAAFKRALQLQPQYVPAYINYANFLQGSNEAAAFSLLQDGLKIRKDAALYHALGLWYVRQGELDKGIEALKTAAQLQPESANFQYVYAVAISEKQPQQAIKILKTALKSNSGNPQILMALASYYQQLGDGDKAKVYRQKAEAVMQVQPGILR